MAYGTENCTVITVASIAHTAFEPSPRSDPEPYHTSALSGEGCVENSGISYSDILILIPDSRVVYDLIFMLFILLILSR